MTQALISYGGDHDLARRGIDRTVRTRIGGWVRQICDPPDGATLIVKELRCREPGCPDVETIVLLGRRERGTVQYRITKPADAVTRDDIQTAVDHEENDR